MVEELIKEQDFVDSLMDEVPAHLWNKLDPDDIIWDEDIPSPKYYVLSKWSLKSLTISSPFLLLPNIIIPLKISMLGIIV